MENWLKQLNHDPREWLLESNPWTRYRTLIDLLNGAHSNPKAVTTREAMLEHEMIRDLVAETHDWLSVAPTRNSDPKISYFKLKMLADFGLQHTDPGLQETVAKAMEHRHEGLFAVRGQLPERNPPGEKFLKPDLSADLWHISPCNSPVITIALLGLGIRDQPVMDAVQNLAGRWCNREGWFCHLFFVESMFRKVQMGCPMAGLQALDVFSRVPELKDSEHVKFAYESIAFHRDYGKSLYYFGRSKKFWTLKYPFVWYNALYMADVLTRFNFLHKEELVRELVDWIIASQNERGRFKPTSIFMNYRGWDFSNKKEASPWISFLCCRILKQYFG